MIKTQLQEENMHLYLLIMFCVILLLVMEKGFLKAYVDATMFYLLCRKGYTKEIVSILHIIAKKVIFTLYLVLTCLKNLLTIISN